jgi:demethylmenaquinone methyltransferase/2-methoxy-6-polyprenyl-1,4-benzoquinol methylase
MSQAIQSMFDAIAGRYDLLNRLLSAGRDVAWRRRSARMLPPLGPGTRVLDLCGGTGDFTAAVQDSQRRNPGRAGSGAAFVLGDFSRPMLALSRPKKLGAPPVVLDALRPPLKDGSFDAVLCGFGMRNLDDTAAGIRAVHALLKPGGSFLTLEFFRPANPFTRFFYGVLAPAFIPFLGRLLGSKRDAYDYLVRSVRGFRSAAEYAALCRAAGFATTRVEARDGGIAHAVLAVKQARARTEGGV